MPNPLLTKTHTLPPTGPMNPLEDSLTALWDRLQTEGQDDKALYLEARNKLPNLFFSVDAYSNGKSKKFKKYISMAKLDIDMSNQSVRSGDYGNAVSWQISALQRLLTVVQTSKNKLAYGYDVSGETGEIFNGSESLANKENEKNLRDENKPENQDETPHNPLNLNRDYQAENDFIGLKQRKNFRISWPPRSGTPALERNQNPYPSPK